MSSRELCLSDLAGRKVRDARGRVVGRITEISAEIELHEHGREYVVHAYHVATFGVFGPIAGLRFVQELVERLGHLVGHRCYFVPWTAMELGDGTRPTLRGELLPAWGDDSP